MKICTKCKEEKKLIEFYKRKDSKDGYSYECDRCRSQRGILYRKNNAEKKKESDKKYRENNPEIIKYNRKKWSKSENCIKGRKRYKEENREKLCLESIKYQKNNWDKLSKYQKRYREINNEKISKYRKIYKKERSNNDPLFKLSLHIRKIILNILKNNGFNKNKKTSDILGCSFDEFKLYIESKFENWMSWDNHGKFTGNYNETWQLDHIIPISSAKTEEEIYELNKFVNFQPLCSRKNAEKRNSIEKSFDFINK